jgi:lipocalin
MNQWVMFLQAVMLASCALGGEAASLRRELTGKPWYCKFWKNAPGCGPTCPVVSPVEPFDLERYIEKSWFIQKQQINPYQSANQLYCVAATYNKQDDSDLIAVDNYGNNDGVNGPPQISDTDSTFSSLCAQVRSETAGKLAVAPCIFGPLFSYLAGDYWVLAIDQEEYSWAIVSGGQPKEIKQQDPIKCTTKKGSSFLDINGSGLWLFTREKVASPEVIAKMESILDSMGVFTGDLLPVAQEGCNYTGANLKL